MSTATYEGRMPTIDDFCSAEPIEEKEQEMFPGFPDFKFTPNDLLKAKSRDKLPCVCRCCKKDFSIEKHYLQAIIKAKQTNIFCSRSCSRSYKHAKKLSSYFCARCGKLVLPKDYYGSGKYCSSHCSHTASGNRCKSKEVKAKISSSLKKYHKHNQKVPVLSQEELIRLNENYSFSDIAKLFSVSRKYISNLAKKYDIADNPIFLSSHSHSVIKVCRHALNKSFEDGSITLDDLEQVRQECIRLMFEDKVPSNDVCVNYLGMDHPNGSFIKNCLHVSRPSLKEIGSRIHEKSLVNKTEREKYYDECKFRFPDELLPYTKSSHLIGKYPWYNPYYPKANGLTKDHMISKNYGYCHKIDSYLISHPANCEIMLRDDNSSKQEKCTLTKEQLIERVEWWNENIIHKIFNDFK